MCVCMCWRLRRLAGRIEGGIDDNPLGGAERKGKEKREKDKEKERVSDDGVKKE